MASVPRRNPCLLYLHRSLGPDARAKQGVVRALGVLGVRRAVTLPVQHVALGLWNTHILEDIANCYASEPCHGGGLSCGRCSGAQNIIYPDHDSELVCPNLLLMKGPFVLFQIRTTLIYSPCVPDCLHKVHSVPASLEHSGA